MQRPRGFDAFRELHLPSFLGAEGLEARKERAKCEMLHIALCWTWIPVLALVAGKSASLCQGSVASFVKWG